MRIVALGHSNRPEAEFLALLAEHAVALVVDVRRFPTSRWVPWANGRRLAETLEAAGIAYVHAPDLGGRRDPLPGSVNTALRDPQLRGYADWMASPGFQAALASLVAKARRQRVAVMCSEARPEDCHRSLLADALVARGVDVVQALRPGEARAHQLPSGARAIGGLVTYPAESPLR